MSATNLFIYFLCCFVVVFWQLFEVRAGSGLVYTKSVRVRVRVRVKCGCGAGENGSAGAVRVKM